MKKLPELEITGLCAKCNNWVTPDFLAFLKASAHVSGPVCLCCLADRSWGYLKRHVIAADYLKVARYKQFSDLTNFHKV